MKLDSPEWQDRVFVLYRRAQKLLDLNSDEAIDPNDYEGEGSECERLLAEMALALAETVPCDEVEE